MKEPSQPRVDEILNAEPRLEDLVERGALEELCTSFQALFGIPIRVLTAEGGLLAGTRADVQVCTFVNESLTGRTMCGATVNAAKNLECGPSGGATHPCVTGQMYRIASIDYDGHRLGKIILGPFAPPTLTDVPPALVALDGAFAQPKLRLALARSPHASPDTVARIAAHLKRSLDLILFSGHKTLLTSRMHLGSVRESYRELKEKNDKLEAAHARLRELDRLKSEFLASVSHELRTPLTAIVGYSEMLAEGLAGPLSPQQSEFIASIRTKSDQLYSLVSGLLDFGKLESGTMRLRFAPTQLIPVLRDAASTIAPIAQKRGVRLSLDLDGVPCEVRGDSERLRQVFTNLLDNAVKFTPQGGRVIVRSRVLTDASTEPGEGYVLLAPLSSCVEIRVIDTGIGIGEAEREKVFDSFYQVDSGSTREYGGTGLGLSIVKKLVLGHEGTIHIENNHPVGTQFIVRVPSITSLAIRAQPQALPP